MCEGAFSCCKSFFVFFVCKCLFDAKNAYFYALRVKTLFERFGLWKVMT